MLRTQPIKTIPALVVAFQVKDHPAAVVVGSEVHSISKKLELIITDSGIVHPEYCPITKLFEQLIELHLLIMTKSYENSVSKRQNCNSIDFAPVGAMIAAIFSLFP